MALVGSGILALRSGQSEAAISLFDRRGKDRAERSVNLLLLAQSPAPCGSHLRRPTPPSRRPGKLSPTSARLKSQQGNFSALAGLVPRVTESGNFQLTTCPSASFQQQASHVIVLRSVSDERSNSASRLRSSSAGVRRRLAIHQPHKIRFAIFLFFSIVRFNDAIGKNHQPVSTLQTRVVPTW